MTNKPDVSAERSAFESWAKAFGRINLDREPWENQPGERYRCVWTQEAWVGWQARAALLANAAGGEPVLSGPSDDAAFNAAVQYCEANGIELEPRDLENLVERISTASAVQPQPAAVQEARDWVKIECFVDEFVHDYEMVGEAQDGQDAYYQPNDNDRALLRDCIAGLLAEPEFLAMLALTAPAVPTEPLSDEALLAVELYKRMYPEDQAAPKAESVCAKCEDWKRIARVQSAKLAAALGDPGADERLKALIASYEWQAEQDDAPPGWKKTAYGWAQSGESILAEEQADGACGSF